MWNLIRLIQLLILVLVLLPLPVAAQETNIASYIQDVFAPGVTPADGAQVWSNTYQASAAACNQTAPAIPPLVVNPTRLMWDDLDHPGKVCIVTLTSTLLPALPPAPGYLSTLKRVDNLGQTSTRSAVSNPFTRQGAPGIPTGVKMLP